MKISVFLMLFVLVAFSSCKKENEQILQGTFKGTFIRSAPAIDYVPSNVTLIFGKTTFSGSSDTPKYPAICSGTWKLENNNKITFDNGCAWTADFDHTLILDGEFEYEWKGKTLYMRKMHGQISDGYQLQKQ